MIRIQTTKENIESKGDLFLAGKIAMKAGLGTIKKIRKRRALSIQF